MVNRNIISAFGPGNGAAALSNVTGVISSGDSYSNQSGQTVTAVKLVMCGWTQVLNANDSNIPNNVNFTASIEYPVASTAQPFLKSASSTLTLTPGGLFISDELTLTTPIPPSGILKINLATESIANAATQKVPQQFNGSATAWRVCGLIASFDSNSAPKSLFIWGDSIFSNNGHPARAAAGAAGIPSITFATGGQNLNGSLPARLANRLALCSALGCTDFITNAGVNDMNAGVDSAGMITNVQAVEAAYKTTGGCARAWHSTITPRTAIAGNTGVVSITEIGSGIYEITLTDGSSYEDGMMYTLSGFTPSQFNRAFKFYKQSTHVVRVHLLAGVGPATVLGTVTRRSGRYAQQAAPTGMFAGGTLGDASEWAAFNTWVRNNYSLVAECARAVGKPGTDQCQWGCEDHPYVLSNPETLTLTVASIQIANTSFTCSGMSSPGANWADGATIQWQSGANDGGVGTIASTSGMRITLSGATGNTIVVGDTLAIRLSTAIDALTTDWLHPSQGINNWGGSPAYLSSWTTFMNALKLL